MAEHGCDAKTSLTFNIHEKRIRGLDQTFQLVLLFLQLCWRVQQIDVIGKNLR